MSYIILIRMNNDDLWTIEEEASYSSICSLILSDQSSNFWYRLINPIFSEFVPAIIPNNAICNETSGLNCCSLMVLFLARDPTRQDQILRSPSSEGPVQGTTVCGGLHRSEDLPQEDHPDIVLWGHVLFYRYYPLSSFLGHRTIK